MTPTDLQTWRKKHGLSQSQLAVLLHVHSRTISAWEIGRQEFPGTILALALAELERHLPKPA